MMTTKKSIFILGIVALVAGGIFFLLNGSRGEDPNANTAGEQDAAPPQEYAPMRNPLPNDVEGLGVPPPPSGQSIYISEDDGSAIDLYEEPEDTTPPPATPEDTEPLEFPPADSLPAPGGF